MKLEIIFCYNKINKAYISSLFSLFMYFVLISYVFIKWIIPVYNYGDSIFAINWINVYLCIIYIIIINYFIVIHLNETKKFFLYILALLTIIPMFCLYAYTEEFAFYSKYMFMCIVCFMVISLIATIEINVSYYKKNITFKRILLPLMTIVVFFTMFRYMILNGLKMFNLDISKVYDYRLQLRETMVGYLAYLDSWTLKIINPFCIVYSFYSSKYFLASFYVMLQVLLFGFSSHKSVLFSAVVLVMFYYMTPIIFKKDTVTWCFIYLYIIALFLYFSHITGLWCLFFQRTFFAPAKLNFYYYDYFSANGFDWFKQSFLRHFINSKYEVRIDHLIGFEYFNNIEQAANTGFLGSGYAQGGFVVMLFYSIIIGTLISLIVALSKKTHKGLAVGLTILPMTSLFTSGDLPTALLSGGLLIALFLLFSLVNDPTISPKNHSAVRPTHLT